MFSPEPNRTESKSNSNPSTAKMWNNCSHYLHQICQPATPKSVPSPSALSHNGTTLSPRLRFPHHYMNSIDSSLQLCNSNYTIASPVYAYPYRILSPRPSPLGRVSSPRILPSPRGLQPWSQLSASPKLQFSPHGMYPYHLNIGKRFGLVPGTPHGSVTKEEDAGQRWRPAPVVLVRELTGSCNTTHGFKTRGIRVGPADQAKMERFKVRTVDIGVVVKEDEKDKS